MTVPKRVQAGVPSGGQFAAQQLRESGVVLDEPSAKPVDTDDVAVLRERAERAHTRTAEHAALTAATGDGLHMSDDPRRSARYRALEDASRRAFGATPEGVAYLAAVRAQQVAVLQGPPVIDLPPRVRSAEVERVLAQAAERRRSERAQSPEQRVQAMSSPALHVTLRSLRRERPTRFTTARIALIEDELVRRGDATGGTR